MGKANPERMNGVNKVVNSLATSQSELGYNVEVWGITKTLVVNYPKRNYLTILFEDVSKFRIDPKFKIMIPQEKEDTIFHFHGAYIPQFHQVSKLLVKYGKQYIYTPHGGYNSIAMNRSRIKKKIYIRLFEKFIVKNAKAVHLIGKSEIEGTRKVFGDVPYILIPNGQEMQVFDPKVCTGTERIVFGFIGRLDVRTKGLDLLLQGFAKLLHQRIEGNLFLHIVGDGNEKRKLEEMTRSYGIENNVKFLGSLYDEEKTNAIDEMDFLCLTSRNEGLPGVVLEASSRGVPVIVSPETNMGGFVKDYNSGFALRINTADEIAVNMMKAFDSVRRKSYKVLSGNALKMIQRKFDWEIISKDMIQEYEK